LDSRERVYRAVEFKSPDRVPFEWYEYRGAADMGKTDIVWIGFKPLVKPKVEDLGNEVRVTDEWGCVWVSYKSIPTMGQPLGHPLRSWEDFTDYNFPEVALEKRFEGVEDAVRCLRERGKYIVGSLDFGIWEKYHFLRGFREAVTDLYTRRENAHKLLSILTEFKIGLIKGYSELGVDCVGFTDDWGTQSGLMISPRLWVEVFKPYYARIFQEARRRGMHTYLHSCGNIYDIIGHLAEVGLNIIQLDAPHQSGIERLSRSYAGRICFNCCIDIQKVLVKGVESEIYEEARKMITLLGTESGGFIARQYPTLYHIGVKPEVNEIAYKAFLKYGVYKSMKDC
jgi:hypothetical protein